MKKKPQEIIKPLTSPARRAPMVRSAYWAWALGAVGGAIWGASQVYLLHGGWGWRGLAALLGVPLGLIAGCDLLIPGPGRESAFTGNRGQRVGPFRWSVLAFLVALEGLIISAYMWGDVTLRCERLATTQVDCHRTVIGWFYSRPIGVTVYDNVIGASLSVHDELLLQHGPYAQSQVATGFGAGVLPQLQTFLTGQTAMLTLAATDWRVRLGAPICLGLALLAGGWALVSFRQGLRILNEQFVLGEIYWGWRAP